MALISRINVSGPPSSDSEDFLASSLGVIFPDDVTNQHGDATHSLTYNSPHLPKPLHLTLCDATKEQDRELFSHFLWNASLQLAELVESSTLSVPLPAASPFGPPEPDAWNVKNKSVIELGAGAALPSLMSALLGARRVAITDYPSPPVLANLAANIQRCCASADANHVFAQGHAWGDLSGVQDEGFALREKGAFDRVFACDCLWMPWQHDNLRRSIAHFLGLGEASKAWVVAGFHTGRENMRGFFSVDEMHKLGLEVNRIWERDCDGVEREWVWDRGMEDIAVRKRWLAIAVLGRRRRRGNSGERNPPAMMARTG